jgi:hypothetical protein
MEVGTGPVPGQVLGLNCGPDLVLSAVMKRKLRDYLLNPVPEAHRRWCESAGRVMENHRSNDQGTVTDMIKIPKAASTHLPRLSVRRCGSPGNHPASRDTMSNVEMAIIHSAWCIVPHI